MMKEPWRPWFGAGLSTGSAILWLTFPAGAAAHPSLEVVPQCVLAGDPVSIRVTGLRAGETVTLRAQSVVSGDDGKPEPYYGEATFMANVDGVIELAGTAPVKGYYQGVDLRGLFWSQRPLASNPEGQQAIAALHLDAPSSIGAGQQVLTLEQGGRVEARALLTFLPTSVTLVRADVRSAGLVGAFYYEHGARKRPVVVVLGGSEGGLDVAEFFGPKLAARGFAVLGVAYLSPPGDAIAGVPTALDRIPIELLATARAWLAGRPEVDIRHLGLVGYSKGAELSLILATSYEWIDAVVAYAPSDVVWQGIRYGGGVAGSSWTRDGRELPYLPTTGTREEIARGRQSDGKIFLARVARANLAAASPQALAAASIPLERSHAALLLIGGGDDQLWDSGASAERLGARLQRAAYPPPFAVLMYPDAGHDLVGTGWQPTTTDNANEFQDGGTPAADARAQADAWTRMLDFLNHALRR